MGQWFSTRDPSVECCSLGAIYLGVFGRVAKTHKVYQANKMLLN